MSHRYLLPTWRRVRSIRELSYPSLKTENKKADSKPPGKAWVVVGKPCSLTENGKVPFTYRNTSLVRPLTQHLWITFRTGRNTAAVPAGTVQCQAGDSSSCEASANATDTHVKEDQCEIMRNQKKSPKLDAFPPTSWTSPRALQDKSETA